MKELKTTVSDKEFHKLEKIAKAQGLPVGEMVHQSVVAYLAQVRAETAFESIGYGMWAQRPEMQDAAAWVHDLRRPEWVR